tara:strand:- start:108 stop:602 length:495 start_codon:yes stop_codon:yes gene_type:complete
MFDFKKTQNNIQGPDLNSKFAMMDRIPLNTKTDYSNINRGIIEKTELSSKFFSKNNISFLQKKIKEGVYTKSNNKFIINDLPEDELLSIMNDIFMYRPRNYPYNISKQIEELNNFVLEKSINDTYNNRIGFINYKRDSTLMHTPISAPLYSNKTDKTLELKPWF